MTTTGLEAVMTFGAYVKNLREKSGLTLRQFCRTSGFDASNWSKVERDLLPPPKSRRQINDIASILALPRDSEAYKTLVDLAAISHLPEELLENKTVAAKLPVFFRTVRSETPSPKAVKELIELFRDKK
jgi:transcriptional regulator with XRE-family HTH domain